MAYTRSGMTTAPYREKRAVECCCCCMCTSRVQQEGSLEHYYMKRFTRCIVCPRVSSFCCMLEEQEKFHQASSYEHVCPLRDVSAIARSAVSKTND